MVKTIRPPTVAEPTTHPDDAALLLKARGVIAAKIYPYVRAVKKLSTMADAEAEAQDLLADLARAGIVLQGFPR